MLEQSVLRLATLVLGGFVLVATVLGYQQVIGGAALATRVGNPRTLESDARIARGRILDRHGVVLAETEPAGGRRYALPALAHAVGYHDPRLGSGGLEAAYDAYLRGERGADPVRRLRDRLLHRAPVGADLALTLDADVARVAAEALAERPGAVVALEPTTGAVLALVSSPGFDPNRLSDQWEAVRDDPGAPLVPRATEGLYPPGSVFKVVTATAAIDLNLVNLDASHDCTTDLVVDGFRIEQRNHPHLRRVTFAQDFAWSDNVTFAKTGLGLGSRGPIDFDDAAPHPYPWERDGVAASVERMLAYTQRFGFGERIPFDLPVAVSRTAPREAFTPVELASTAFGQGSLATTPLLMALMVASIANGGVMPAPYLVGAIGGPVGSVERPHQSGQRLRQVASPATAAAMNRLLVQSVDEGYARPAQIPGVRVAGKTGTAEVAPGHAPHAWFVGYAPAESPRVAVAVVLEHGGSGTEVATPIGRRVMEAALARPAASPGWLPPATAAPRDGWAGAGLAGAYCPLPRTG